MENIFNDFGIEIDMMDNKYYLRYDAGELVPHFEVIEISREEAETVQLSSENAYQVIVKYQNEAMQKKRNSR